MNRLFILVFFVLGTTTLVAQKSPSLHLGYWGPFPAGVKIGVDYPFLQKIAEKQIERKRRGKIITLEKRRKHELIGGFSFAYTPYTNSHNFLLNPEVAYRRTASNGYFIDFWLGFAYENITNKGKTFTVDNSGNVSTVAAASRGYFAPNLSFGMGYDLSMKEILPLAFYLKLIAIGRTNYNNLNMILNGRIDLGIMYKF